MHAKTYNPRLSDDAMSILNKCYAELAHRNRVSPRRLETLYNLAIARAKLKLKETVDIEDAIETVEFYNRVIEDYNDAIAIADNPRDIAASKVQELLEEYSKSQLTTGPMNFTDLIAIVREKDLQVKLYIGDDLSMRSNYKLRPIAQLVESNPRVRRTKTKPLMLQWIQPVVATT
jgi:DNA replicative helicase MCM subunit Mcm2 (Cdc46/Mcm family)